MTRILTIIIAACLWSYGVGAQVIVRDHRLGKGIKYIPRPPQPVSPSPTAKPPIPAAITNFAVDNTYHTEVMMLPGRSQALLMSSSAQVFLGNRLQLGTGTVSTSPADPQPREMMIYVDTLTIDGQCIIDLSQNKLNANGFLFLACRILDLRGGGHLSVNLSGRQGEKYRKFYLFAQQVALDGHKVFDEAATLPRVISRGDPPILYWRRLRVGETAPPASIKDGKILDTLKFDPLQLTVGYLPAMRDEHPAFFTFFSRWVEESYKDLKGQIARNRDDRMMVARQYVRFRALNNYTGLESPYQDRCTALVEEINNQKDKDFKNGFQFDRTVTVGNRTVRMLSSLQDDGIVNYIPPSIALISPALVNGRTIAGYRIFDEAHPGVSVLDFDVVLAGDTRLKTAIDAALSSSNDTVGVVYDEMKFSDFRVEGADLLAAGSGVTVVGNNLLNVRLATDNATTVVFSKLFSVLGSDILLRGKWANKTGEISGDLQIPLTFARMINQPVTAADGGITNRSSIPATVEFFVDGDSLVDLSPAIAIDSGKTITGLYGNKNSRVEIPPDGLLFRLDANRYGDYFEQIDNSDRVTQELTIENHLTPAPADSLSGYFQYADLTVDYPVNGANVVRRTQLAPADAMGSTITLAILKNTKDAVPLTISGKAVYENGERDINQVTLSNGESRFDLQAKDLKNP